MSECPCFTLRQVQGGECEENGKGSGVRSAQGTRPSHHDNGKSSQSGSSQRAELPVPHSSPEGSAFKTLLMYLCLC